MDRKTLTLVAEYPGSFATVPTMNADGSLMIFGTDDPSVEVLDYLSGVEAAPPLDLTPWASDELDSVNMVDLDSTDTRLLVSLSSGTTLLFRIDGWEQLGIITPEDGGGAVAARFLPDDDTIVTRNQEGSVTLRDGRALTPIGELPTGQSASENLSTGPYISADGEYLLTVREQQPRLIHIPSRTEIGVFPNDSGVATHGADVGAELQLVTGVGEHALVWNLDIDTWPDIACQAVGRNLTEDEWDQFGPETEPYQPTCPQWPSPRTSD